MYWVYVLSCGDGSLYTGITTDPERRLREHNSGKGAKYTRARLPVVMSYLEEAPDRASASRREWELKALSRGEKLKLVEEYQQKKP